ncbi:MAG: response regulator transcription factor [Candidatus Gastranaerophilales bacterium]|nr:response regulator transcription factor [Candidatus Gastranaerophilales bacterium]
MFENFEIMLVDNHTKIAGLLAKNGFNVNLFFSTEKMMEQLSKENFKNNLILLNTKIYKLDWCSVIQSIRKKQIHSPLVVITNNPFEEKIVSMLKSGADDFIISSIEDNLFLAKISVILRRNIKEKALMIKNKENNILTTREKEILLLIAQGKSNKMVAENLFLSELTVKTHLKNIFKKLAVSNRTQAILYAINRGLIAP